MTPHSTPLDNIQIPAEAGSGNIHLALSETHTESLQLEFLVSPVDLDDYIENQPHFDQSYFDHVCKSADEARILLTKLKLALETEVHMKSEYEDHTSFLTLTPTGDHPQNGALEAEFRTEYLVLDSEVNKICTTRITFNKQDVANAIDRLESLINEFQPEAEVEAS
jgi:hypothetical protein